MITVENIKICTSCYNEFPATTEFFYKNYRSGLDRRCKTCRKEASSKRKVLPNKNNLISKTCKLCDMNFPATEEFFYKNKFGKFGIGSRCKNCMNSLVMRKSPTEAREYKLKSRYGISIKDFNQLLKTQNYTCKICNRHISEFSNGLSVDHDHITGKIRGLLCVRCNILLGCAQDNIEICRRAADYLEVYKKVGV